VLLSARKSFLQDPPDGDRYFLCVSTPDIEEAENLTVLRFPWVKKSWLHRLFFDHVTVRRLIKTYQIDRVLSLQNLAAPVKLPQTIFVQQALPFSDVRFHLFRQPKYWVRQNLIGRGIRRSCRRAEKVIVQAEWMKRAVCEKAKISTEKVEVRKPKAPAAAACFDRDRWDGLFFYPAAAYPYKNHRLILAAAALLEKRGVGGWRVMLTLTPGQLDTAEFSKNIQNKLIFTGPLPYNKVTALYAASALLFPSYIETVGLPLLEARAAGCPILAADRPFAREALEGYPDAVFFDPFKAEELADRMEELLKK